MFGKLVMRILIRQDKTALYQFLPRPFLRLLWFVIQGCLPLRKLRKLLRNHYWNWPRITVVQKLILYYGD